MYDTGTLEVGKFQSLGKIWKFGSLRQIQSLDSLEICEIWKFGGMDNFEVLEFGRFESLEVWGNSHFGMFGNLDSLKIRKLGILDTLEVWRS